VGVKTPLCEAQSFPRMESAGECSAPPQIFWEAVVCGNANVERERDFAKCWGSGGKYFAKFASRTS